MNSVQEKSIIYCDRSKKIRRGKIRYIMTKTANHQPITIDIYQYYIEHQVSMLVKIYFRAVQFPDNDLFYSVGFHFTITH